MSINIMDIIIGWRNHLFPPSAMKEVIEKVSEERLAICNECGHHSKYHKTIRPDAHCTLCQCTLIAKTKCLSCECPINKWNALISPEEEETIEDNGE